MFKIKVFLNHFNALHYLLVFTVIVTVLYFGSTEFRGFIKEKDIDSNMVVGFISAYTLLFALFQSAKDRRFAYKMAVTSKFEELGFQIIAELLLFDTHRNIFVETVRNIKDCMISGKVYKDANDIKQLATLGKSTAAAAIVVYFPEQSVKWNKIIDLMSEMGTLALNVNENYKENDNGIIKTPFLQNMEHHMLEVLRLNSELADMPREVAEAVIEQINVHKLRLRNA